MPQNIERKPRDPQVTQMYRELIEELLTEFSPDKTETNPEPNLPTPHSPDSSRTLLIDVNSRPPLPNPKNPPSP